MRRILALAGALLLLVSACGAPAAEEEDGTLRVLATTYPVYLFAAAVTEGVEGVEVSLLVNQQTSCLHDYTLTVSDMKAIEAADVILMNGAGLEDFMDDALASSGARAVDCAEGVELLPAQGHEGHDHDTEYDPHIWMDPDRAARMAENIGAGLAGADPEGAETYTANAQNAARLLRERKAVLRDAVTANAAAGLPHRALITFHDGFQYFAEAFGFTMLKSIEEEEGSEASAADIKEIVSLVEENGLPAVFTEVNGSDATARAIARETGCGVYQLDLLMSGEGGGLEAYWEGISQNVSTAVNALGGGQVILE